MKHRAVIEAGPATFRRLCCGAAQAAEAAAALEWIDEPTALVEGRPVELRALLRSVLACAPTLQSLEIIHPSWWPARRLEVVTAAARDLAEDIVTRPRSRLLLDTFQAGVVVEIAPRLVAVTVAGTTEITAQPRIGSPDEVAAAVARDVVAAARDRCTAVAIDAPVGVGGAAALATMIAERVGGELDAVTVDELPAGRAAEPVAASEPAPAPARGRMRLPLVTAAALAATALGLQAYRPPDPVIPATYLVEGRVALQVPGDWAVRRVTGGPGSARVEVASPIDPEMVLHLTQAPAAGETLAAVAEPLKRALHVADAATPGVFVGFDPAGSRAGRPAVTYREIRDGHHVDWAVLVEGAVQIGIGCQCGPGGDDALRAVCEQAVRSAHGLGVPPTS